ncbi:restriction endonuclease subunit S [Photobacterium damselae]|uniref:restriction endonuclease subunit S n=1 Tax=Photobacterium damselae TaxID=38293 RepID=UPI002090756F|nr:restriction endonuclease subunit S [Photobacterium damselae]USR75592.1 restriction endonuclease subunit S [Photobacterium damselae]
MVPNGWNKKKLTSLCDKIAVGLAISVTPYMASSGVKLIRNQNIKRNYFNTKSVVYITDEFATKNNSKRVYKGDVVAVRTGSNIGEACVVPTEFDGALTFTTLIARPKVDKLNSDYLSTHINSEYGVAEVQRLMAGGGKPNLNSGELKNYTLLTPPLPEQRKIAQILSTWDRGIATTEKLIDASKQQKKALMQQLLTGKKRLIDPETGKAFEGDWERKRVGDVTKKFANKNKESANITVFSVTNNAGFVKQNEHFSKEVASEDRSTYKIIQCGDFAYNPARINVGSIARFDQDIGIISSLYVCFQLSASVQSDFFLQWLSTEKTIFDYSRYGEGSVRVYLWYEQFSMIEILLPSLDEQQKIVSVLTAADKEIELLEAKLAHLKQEKKALMQQLLTGKRRVNIAETKVATEEILEAEVA